MCICGLETGQMYFSVYYARVRRFIPSKYTAGQMGISREKTTTVTTLFAVQLDKILQSVQSKAELLNWKVYTILSKTTSHN